MLNFPNDNTQLLSFYSPYNSYKGLISIPHSGEHIPKEFTPFLLPLHQLKSVDINMDVDLKVHELIDIETLRHNGIAVLVSNIHRVPIDLNRSKDKALLFWEKNTQGTQLLKVQPDKDKCQKLLNRFYVPYYELLKSALNNLETIFEKVPFVDLHSMPSNPTAHHLKTNPSQATTRPSLCISNYKGTTSSPEYIDSICKHFSDIGIDFLQNDPYLGGYVTQYVGNNFKSESIQIEINRSLYMNEDTKEIHQVKVIKLKEKITSTLIQHFDFFSTKYKKN